MNIFGWNKTPKTIKQIGKEMSVQNNRATQFPLFVVQQDVKRWVNEYGDHDGKDIADMGYCSKHDEDNEDQACLRCEWNYYQIDQEFELMPGVFLTAKACQKHIDENYYHYWNPRVYGISTWRNPEMQAVEKYLVKVSSSSLPGHYQ